MANESKPKEPNADLLEDAFQSRTAAVAAMDRYAEAAYRSGFNDGWGKGYDTGRDSALSDLRNHIAQVAPPPPPVPVFKKASPYPPITIKPRLGTKELVLEYLAGKPGARGVEVAQELGKVGISERTVRTALHRLKRDKQIEVRDGGWHIREGLF